MSLVSIENLSLSFGAEDVFQGLGANLPNDGKVGLVGPNGVGKTSLFRIIAGLIPPTTGSVRLAQGCRVGYLHQEAVEAFANSDHTVWEEMLTAFAHIRGLGRRMEEMEARMAAGEADESLLDAYGATQEEFERLDGYQYESRIKQVLDGLGFGAEQWDTPIGYLSGGQKTRALLARLLLEQPSFLMLDEPTNHLDMQATQWLERTLQAWKGALLIASHDRYFLDNVVNRVWEMSSHHIESYRGNYTAYVQQREERWERNRQVYESEMERLNRELELVRRYIAWRKFDEGWGKLKRLSRELLAIQHNGILGIQGKSWSEMGVHKAKMMSIAEAHEAIKAIKPPATRPPRLHLRLKSTVRGGEIVLRTSKLHIGYSDTPLFAAGDLLVERLERVALIGPNGAGKTTFLRTVLGELPPPAGEVRLGANLRVGYFAQAHDSLNPDRSVIDELSRHRDMSLGEARNYLAQYLFRGDDVWKPVRALSGGERARLALAILAVEGVNLLLLDEPTNHLDIPAQEVLQEGLEQFDGTIILVSHDRYLVDRLATQIWEIRDGQLKVFNGSYHEMLEAAERAAQAAAPEPAGRRTKLRGRPDASKSVEQDRATLVAALEEQITAAEAALAEYTRQMQEGGEAGDLRRVRELGEAYEEVQEQLDRLLEEWMKLGVP